MVGGRATHDIYGAVAAGMRSVWIARGRLWTEPGLPTVQRVRRTPFRRQ